MPASCWDRLVGLATALLQPSPTTLLAALAGLDLHGSVMRQLGREVFVLSGAAALVEIELIAPSR
jgi:hypothetical protein